jgi:hypothetical protein
MVCPVYRLNICPFALCHHSKRPWLYLTERRDVEDQFPGRGFAVAVSYLNSETGCASHSGYTTDHSCRRVKG